MGRRPWSEDELIVALELYVRSRPSELTKADPELIRVAKLTGRSPDAVYMKLCNFLSIDPTYSGDGLMHGARADRLVWQRFSARRPELAAEAAAAGRRLAP
jgi:5-methylcytosine-specific restriction enzyme A